MPTTSLSRPIVTCILVFAVSAMHRTPAPLSAAERAAAPTSQSSHSDVNRWIERATAAASTLESNTKAQALGKIASAQLRLGDWKSAWKTALQVPVRRTGREDVLCGALCAALRARDIPSAEAIRKAIDRTEWAGIIVDAAIGYAEAGELARAKAFAQDEQTDAERKAEVYANVALVQAKAGDSAGAARTFQEALDAADSLEFEGRMSARILIARKLFVAGQREQASEMLAAVESALDAPVDPDAPYDKAALQGRLLSAKLRIGDVAGARQTSLAMKSEEDKLSHLRSIVYTMAERGNYALARMAANAVPAVPQRIETLLEVASFETSAEDFRGAAKTLAIALPLGMGLADERERSRLCPMIARELASIGDWRSIESIIKALPADLSHEYAPFLSSAKLQSKDFAGAKLAADVLDQRSYVRNSLYEEIAAAQARSGEIAAAMQTAEQINWFWFQALAYGQIAAVQAKRGDQHAADTFAAAVAAADRIDVDGREAIFRSIAYFQIDAGDLAGARRSLATAYAAVDHVPPERQGLRYIAIGSCQIRIKDIDGAARSFAAARGQASDPRTLCNVALDQIRAGDTDGAMLTMAQDTSVAAGVETERFYAFSQIGEALAKAGEFVRLDRLVNGLSDPYARCGACVGAVVGLAPLPEHLPGED